MLETIAIISNAVVIAAIGALYKKVNSQEKTLNTHIVNFTKEITGRPNFDQVSEKLKEVEQRQCGKVKLIKECCDSVKEKLFAHLLESK